MCLVAVFEFEMSWLNFFKQKFFKFSVNFFASPTSLFLWRTASTLGILALGEPLALDHV